MLLLYNCILPTRVLSVFPTGLFPRYLPLIKAVQVFHVSPFETHAFSLQSSRFHCPINIHTTKVVWVKYTQIFTYFCFFDTTISNNCNPLSTEHKQSKLKLWNYPGLTSHRKKNNLFYHVI
jgi:hypothetical protein